MAVERAGNILRSDRLSAGVLSRPDIAFESERQTIEKSIGIDLTNVILSHLNLNLLTMPHHNPIELLSNTPSYPKLRTLNELKNPEDETKLFTELFASALTKSWTVTDIKNISEKEKRLVFHCAELRNKGYDLKRVMQEVCRHFNLSLTQALEIAKKEYFTIDDLAQELEMNRTTVKNRILETVKKNRTITTERFGGKGHNRIFIPKSQQNNFKSIVKSSIQKTTVTLPDNSVTPIWNGRLRKKILDMFLQTFNEPHGLALDKVIDLYPKGNRNARKKARYVIASLKERLQAFGWTIENQHIKTNPRQKYISAYFLKKIKAVAIENPVVEMTIQPSQPEVKKETAIFELKDVKPGIDPKLYAVPKGEKSFYELTDIAQDLGVSTSHVRAALGKKGIKAVATGTRSGGRKVELRLTYPEYQILKPGIGEEIGKMKKKAEKAAKRTTSSPVTIFQAN